VEIEGIEPTNNLAEQQIRFYVLWRKNSFGTQSERGNMFVERMMTTTATCKLQNRNGYGFVYVPNTSLTTGTELWEAGYMIIRLLLL